MGLITTLSVGREGFTGPGDGMLPCGLQEEIEVQ